MGFLSQRWYFVANLKYLEYFAMNFLKICDGLHFSKTKWLAKTLGFESESSQYIIIIFDF